jgi:hypothetical protein
LVLFGENKTFADQVDFASQHCNFSLSAFGKAIFGQNTDIHFKISSLLLLFGSVPHFCVLETESP